VTLSQLLHPLSSLVVPLFSVLMGLQVDVVSLLSPTTLVFAGILTIGAFVGKLAGAAGLVSRGADRMAVGIGMIPEERLA